MMDLNLHTYGHVARRQAERLSMSNPSRQADRMSFRSIALGTAVTVVCFVLVIGLAWITP